MIPRFANYDVDDIADARADHWIQALAAGINATNSFLGGLMGMRNTDKTNAANKKITRETNEANQAITDSVNATNKAIADQNLAFQQDSLEYQKALNQQIMEREDTAYQRTVDDMRAAGLSPLSIQGTNGSGGVVSAPDAMHNDFQAQGYTAQGYQAQGYDSALAAFADGLNAVSSTIAQSDLLRAQAKKTNAEADNITIKNAYEDSLLEADLIGRRLHDWHGAEDFFEKYRSNEYKRSLGVVDGMSDDERKAVMLMRSLGINLNDDREYVFENKGKRFTSGDSVFNASNATKLADTVNAIQVASGLKDILGDFSFPSLKGLLPKGSVKK